MDAKTKLQKHFKSMLFYEKLLCVPHGYRLVSIENNACSYLTDDKFDKLMKLLRFN